jgi:hypothetical protein
MVATTTFPRSAEAAVQEQRLPQLLDDVAVGALCASPAPGIPEPDEWHRADGEQAPEWRKRRDGLVTVCAACPVRAACKESALRQGEGDGDPREINDLVRGGMTGLELHDARTEQADRLAAARIEDERAMREEREIRVLAGQLRNAALVHCDPRSAARVNGAVRAKADELRTARNARRARSGWSSAA